MEQIAIVARLKSGAEPRAAELIAAGPPFRSGHSGLEGHTVYLAADEVVFVFEGREVEWIVDGLVDEPLPLRLFWPRSTIGGHSSMAIQDRRRCSPGSGKSSSRPRRLANVAPFHGYASV